MAFSDTLTKLIPSIKGPEKEQTRQEKIRWTIAVAIVYLIIYFVPPLGVINSQNAFSALTSIYFPVSLAIVGVPALGLSVVLMILFNGSRLFNFGLKDALGKARFYSVRKLITIIAAIIFSFGSALQYPSFSYLGVVVQLFIGALIVMYLDEIETKRGIIGSGLLLFLAITTAYTLLSFTINISLPTAALALATGGVGAISNELQAFFPVLITIILILGIVKIYDSGIGKLFSAFIDRDDNWEKPLSRIFVTALPIILALATLTTLSIWATPFLAGSNSYLSNFIAHYNYYTTPLNSTPKNYYLDGGLLYLANSGFPLPYSTQFGGYGTYTDYINYLSTKTSALILPSGQTLYVPEFLHAVTYTITLILLTLIYGAILLNVIRVNHETLRERLAKAHDEHGMEEKAAIAIIYKDLGMLGAIIGLSIVLGSVIGSNVIAGAVSLYVVYGLIKKDQQR